MTFFPLFQRKYVQNINMKIMQIKKVIFLLVLYSRFCYFMFRLQSGNAGIRKVVTGNWILN